MAKGCEWNNSLSKENFRANVKEHGVEYAKQVLRTDIAHWMAKREGRPVPTWKASVDDGGHLVVEGQRLIDITKAPLTKEVHVAISDEVKALVPIEAETVRQADRQASQGAKKIYMPEHAPGGIRFITVYTQSADNPREYIGSQIDLGENLTWDQVKERMQMIGGAETKQVHQSAMHKEAFVVVENNKDTKRYQKSVVDVVMTEAVATSRRVLTDVTSTAVSAGIFALESLRRRRAQQQLRIKEVQNKEVLTRKNKKESKISLLKERRYGKSKKKEIRRIFSAVTISQFATETGVGIGAALFGLRQLVELPKKERRHTRKNIEKHLKMKSKEWRRRKAEVLKKKSKEVMKKEKRSFKKEVWMQTRKNKEMRRYPRKEKNRAALPELAIFRTEVAIWKTLVRLVHKLQERKPTRKKRLKESPAVLGKKFTQGERQQIRVKEKKRVVVKFVFAWLLWVFLRKLESKHVLLQQPFKKVKKIETLVKEEPTQWVLLAIIWYLVMIRESRGAGSRFAGQTHPKKQVTYLPPTYQMPPRGVIFAFAS